MTGRILLLLSCIPGILSSSCMSATNEKLISCKECVTQAEAGCGWCLEGDPGNDGFAKGCVTAANCTQALVTIDEKWEIVAAPRGEKQEYIKPKKAGTVLGEGRKKVVVTSRPNVRHKIEFKAKKAENRVDIYFLVDLTKSMEKIKDLLPGIFGGLVAKISTKTQDFKFGFGSFTEKPVPPFDSYTEKKRFNFEHHQSMTADTAEISKTIQDAKVHKNNLDSAEAGFDGLMQLLLCSEDHIGWRKNAKGIIVFISDAASHLSGDGLLGGLWKPYEHVCKLEDPKNTNDEDTTTAKKVYDGLNTDYPSVSAIRYELVNHDKFIVFGNSQNVLLFYSKLVEALGARYASANNIGENGDLILQVVGNEYDKIEGQMTIKTHNVGPNMTATLKDGGQYDDIIADKFIDYYIEVTLKPEMCTDAPRGVTFELEISGQAFSKLEIEVKPVCECDSCKTPGDDSKCNKKDRNAKMICGSCECEHNIGDSCQCDPSDSLKNTTKCENENGDVCSKQGQCECEKCVCNPGHSGEKCECDDTENKCKGRGDAICLGSKIECRCYYGFEHPDDETKDCSCSTLKKEDCQDPVTATECNGRGNCRCNKCECEGDFGRKFCQKNTALTTAERDEETCKVLQACVLEKKYSDDSAIADSLKNQWKTECEKLKGHSVYQITTDIEDLTPQPTQHTDKPANSTEDSEDYPGNDFEDYGTNDGDDSRLAGQKQCYIRSSEWGGASGCALTFHHNVPRGGVMIYDEGMMKIDLTVGGIKCGIQVPMELLIGSSVGTGVLLFLIGFLSYCIIINIRDRNEFKKFLAEQAELDMQGDFVENPAYRANRSSIRKSIRKSLMPGTKVSFGQGD